MLPSLALTFWAQVILLPLAGNTGLCNHTWPNVHFNHIFVILALCDKKNDVFLITILVFCNCIVLGSL